MPPHAGFFACNYTDLWWERSAPIVERHIVVPASLQIWRVPIWRPPRRMLRRSPQSGVWEFRKSTLTRGGPLQYARSVKRRWWLTGVLCVATAMVGYGAASRRAAVLETFLDRMTLEQDSLRAVMAEQEYMLERVTDARMSDDEVGEVERLRTQLDQTTAFLNEARSTADERSRALDSQHAVLLEKDTALRTCSDVQARLEQQLESCIFEKAAFEKRVRGAAQPSAHRPTSGVSPFSQSIEFPDTAGN